MKDYETRGDSLSNYIFVNDLFIYIIYLFEFFIEKVKYGQKIWSDRYAIPILEWGAMLLRLHQKNQRP